MHCGNTGDQPKAVRTQNTVQKHVILGSHTTSPSISTIVRRRVLKGVHTCSIGSDMAPASLVLFLGSCMCSNAHLRTVIHGNAFLPNAVSSSLSYHSSTKSHRLAPRSLFSLSQPSTFDRSLLTLLSQSIRAFPTELSTGLACGNCCASPVHRPTR